MIKSSAHLAKATRALLGAKTLLKAGDTDGACSRAYYAMFDAAHAALWASGARTEGEIIKTHNGLVAAFGEHLVKPKKIAPEQGRALALALKTRLLADYTADSPSPEDAAKLVTLAETFLSAVKTAFPITE